MAKAQSIDSQDQSSLNPEVQNESEIGAVIWL